MSLPLPLIALASCILFWPSWAVLPPDQFSELNLDGGSMNACNSASSTQQGSQSLSASKYGGGTGYDPRNYGGGSGGGAGATNNNGHVNEPPIVATQYSGNTHAGQMNGPQQQPQQQQQSFKPVQQTGPQPGQASNYQGGTGYNGVRMLQQPPGGQPGQDAIIQVSQYQGGTGYNPNSHGYQPQQPASMSVQRPAYVGRLHVPREELELADYYQWQHNHNGYGNRHSRNPDSMNDKAMILKHDSWSQEQMEMIEKEIQVLAQQTQLFAKTVFTSEKIEPLVKAVLSYAQSDLESYIETVASIISLMVHTRNNEWKKLVQWTDQLRLFLARLNVQIVSLLSVATKLEITVSADLAASMKKLGSLFEQLQMSVKMPKLPEDKEDPEVYYWKRLLDALSQGMTFVLRAWANIAEIQVSSKSDARTVSINEASALSVFLGDNMVKFLAKIMEDAPKATTKEDIIKFIEKLREVMHGNINDSIDRVKEMFMKEGIEETVAQTKATEMFHFLRDIDCNGIYDSGLVKDIDVDEIVKKDAPVYYASSGVIEEEVVRPARVYGTGYTGGSVEEPYQPGSRYGGGAGYSQGSLPPNYRYNAQMEMPVASRYDFPSGRYQQQEPMEPVFPDQYIRPNSAYYTGGGGGNPYWNR